MKFSLIIPAHNEAESLAILVPEIIKMVKKLSRLDRGELLLVDDASTDQTKAVIREFARKHRWIRPVFLRRRSGQTGCFRAAFAKARGDYLIRMDADLQDSPADLPLFLKAFHDGADLVMGLRECRQHRRLYRLASYVYDFLVVLIFNSPLHANSGSFVGFRADLVRGLDFKKNDHRYLPLIAMRRGARNIREVFVRHGQRRFGESKYQPLPKLLLGFFEVWRLFFRIKTGYYDARD